MIKINVITNNNAWLSFIKYPINYIDRRINKINVNDKTFSKKNIFCTLLLSGNREIKNLNKKFRKKNKATDVLSFPFYTKKEFKKILKKEEELYLGDIIINLNKIKNKSLKKNFKIEFDRLWIHGLLHLFGYVHKREKDFKKMNQKEKFFFDLVND